MVRPSDPSGLDDSRDTDGDAVVGDVADNYGVGANDHIVAYRDSTQNLGPGANVDIVAYVGRGRLIDPCQADHHAVADPAIVAKFRIPADDYAPEMVDDEVGADLYFAGQFDASDDLYEFEQNLVEQGEWLAQEGGPHTVAPASETIDQQDPEALGAPISLVCA